MKKKLLIATLLILTLLIITGSIFIIKKENDTKKDVSEKVVEEMQQIEEEEKWNRETKELEEKKSQENNNLSLEEFTCEFHKSNKLNKDICIPKEWRMVELDDPKAGIALRSPYYVPIVSGYVMSSGEIYIDFIDNNKQLDIETFFRKKLIDGSDLFNHSHHEKKIIAHKNAILFPEVEDGRYRYREFIVNCGYELMTVSYVYLENKRDESIVSITDRVTEMMAQNCPLK